ncbi:MAG: double-CXXCG motif protein [Verrucomicrobiota bacterium]
MRFFQIEESKPYTYQFDGEYTWLLRSVKCSICHRSNATFLGCPLINIKGKLDESAYGHGPPVTRQEFESLTAPLRSEITEPWPLLPGMGFGPFIGRVLKGEKRDFLWIFGRTLLIRESAYQALNALGISLRTGPAIITSSKVSEVRNDYLRIVYTIPIPCLSQQALVNVDHRHCDECGIYVRSQMKQIILNKHRIPEGIDIFAVQSIERIIVTEKLRDAVRQLKLTNITFNPAETSE